MIGGDVCLRLVIGAAVAAVGLGGAACAQTPGDGTVIVQAGPYGTAPAGHSAWLTACDAALRAADHGYGGSAANWDATCAGWFEYYAHNGPSAPAQGYAIPVRWVLITEAAAPCREIVVPCPPRRHRKPERHYRDKRVRI